MIILIILVILILLFMLNYESKKLKRIASTEGFLKYCALGLIYCIMWLIPLYLSAYVGFIFSKGVGEITFILPLIIFSISVFCWISLCSYYPKLSLPTKFLWTLFIIGNLIYKLDEEVYDLKNIKKEGNNYRHNSSSIDRRYLKTFFSRRPYRSFDNNTDDILLFEFFKILKDLRNRNRD